MQLFSLNTNYPILILRHYCSFFVNKLWEHSCLAFCICELTPMCTPVNLSRGTLALREVLCWLWEWWSAETFKTVRLCPTKCWMSKVRGRSGQQKLVINTWWREKTSCFCRQSAAVKLRRLQHVLLRCPVQKPALRRAEEALHPGQETVWGPRVPRHKCIALFQETTSWFSGVETTRSEFIMRWHFLFLRMTKYLINHTMSLLYHRK